MKFLSKKLLSPVLLIGYIGLIFPVAQILKILHIDPMQRRCDKKQNTYWQTLNQPAVSNTPVLGDGDKDPSNYPFW